jgi:NAD(P)-dependent dehydrogenase (short-subunit alcohol dehydrogenase family)
MAQRLKGKSAVVTGGGDGIGRAVALALAVEGARVVVNDIGRDPDGKSSANKVVEEITKAGGTAVANYDSVATMSGGENIIKTAISNFGRIDILVNCAGNFKPVKITDMTENDWDSIMAVHLKGHFSCTKAAVLEMIKQQSGRIINISSRSAAFGAVSAAYSAAKAGIMGFTLEQSEELKQYGIAVNAILPSATTKLFPGTRTPIGDNMPASLNMEPDSVAPIIVYLATDEAKYITSRLIYASGGDLCIFGRPLQLPGETPIFLHKIGKWTLDELSAVIPPLMKLGAG